MLRRDFLKLASIAGVSLAAGVPFHGRARAEGTFAGPFWIMVHADGGWDPTLLCDPKGATSLSDPARTNNYLTTDIEDAGKIRYAPIGGNPAFFQKHYSSLLVVNGIDTATNNHDAGIRNTWSGSLLEHSPALAALLSGSLGPDRPMSFISNGGYEITRGSVAVSRVADVSQIGLAAEPNKVSPDKTEETYFPGETYQRIKEARRARNEAALARQNLPRLRASRAQLSLARTGEADLAKVMQFLPGTLETATLRSQAQVAVAAFRAGVSVCANLSLLGFDTHINHDNAHTARMTELLDGVSFLCDELESYPETAGNAVVVVGSDFGRTARYNAGGGKDHWSITSMMLWGKGITGNRVVGATDESLVPQMVDPSTLQVSSDGVRLTPAHVHKALRKLGGIEDAALATQFPIADVEDMPLLG
jgi:uncharacterized protein (DUF1501 family)